MRINEARHRLRAELIPLYGEAEASAIAAMVIEKLTGYKRADLLLHGEDEWGDDKQDLYTKYVEDLKAWHPVQYVLGEAWFCGMSFFVDERVLIPRPETEELVEWIRTDAAPQLPREQFQILDIGTGSGCIAIALKKQLPLAELRAVDISTAALEVAARNAEQNGARVQFEVLDILDAQSRLLIPSMDVIVSNPPYIPKADAASMRPNVLQHEPHLALFVDDTDPLVFYRSIGLLGLEKLKPGGALYVELHEGLALAVQEMLGELGYKDLLLKKDMQGKWRMLRARP